jgi:hypothetical protein
MRYLVVFRNVDTGRMLPVKLRAVDREAAVTLAVERLKARHAGSEEWDRWEVKRVARSST